MTAFGGNIVDQNQLRHPLSPRFFPVSLIFPAHLAIALNMAMMIPTERIEPIDVEASRIGNNGPYAARRMDLANASMGQLGTDDGYQD